MKSLEIVNRMLKEATDENLMMLLSQYVWELETIQQDLEVLETLCNDSQLTMGELLKIAKSLEVLEILRKNLYIEYDTRLYVKHSFDDEHKDFNKVKQWLEGNNERD